MLGFIASYRGVRYNLKEQAGKEPMNHRELFNLRHSSLRSKIESAFGIWKNRFRILSPDLPYESQVKIEIACCVLHNYIMQVDPDDRFIQEYIDFDEGPGDDFDEEVEFTTTNMTVQQQKEANKFWLEKREKLTKDMWVDYYAMYRGGNETEISLQE